MNNFKSFISKNSPIILSVIGAGGVIITAGLTAKATIKVNELYNSLENKDELTKKDIVRLYWKEYIPAGLSAGTTIACIFGANYMNNRIKASLASAYCLLQNSYMDYKKATNELYKDADIKIQNKICENKYNENPVICDDNELLFYDTLSCEFVECTMDKMLQYESEFLEILHRTGRVSLNQWERIIGNSQTIIGDELVWYSNDYHDVNGYPDVEIEIIPDTLSNGMKVNVIHFTIDPELDWLLGN